MAKRFLQTLVFLIPLLALPYLEPFIIPTLLKHLLTQEYQLNTPIHITYRQGTYHLEQLDLHMPQTLPEISWTGQILSRYLLTKNYTIDGMIDHNPLSMSFAPNHLKLTLGNALSYLTLEDEIVCAHNFPLTFFSPLFAHSIQDGTLSGSSEHTLTCQGLSLQLTPHAILHIDQLHLDHGQDLLIHHITLHSSQKTLASCPQANACLTRHKHSWTAQLTHLDTISIPPLNLSITPSHVDIKNTYTTTTEPHTTTTTPSHALIATVDHPKFTQPHRLEIHEQLHLTGPQIECQASHQHFHILIHPPHPLHKLSQIHGTYEGNRHGVRCTFTSSFQTVNLQGLWSPPSDQLVIQGEGKIEDWKQLLDTPQLEWLDQGYAYLDPPSYISPKHTQLLFHIQHGQGTLPLYPIPFQDLTTTVSLEDQRLTCTNLCAQILFPPYTLNAYAPYITPTSFDFFLNHASQELLRFKGEISAHHILLDEAFSHLGSLLPHHVSATTTSSSPLPHLHGSFSGTPQGLFLPQEHTHITLDAHHIDLQSPSLNTHIQLHPKQLEAVFEKGPLLGYATLAFPTRHTHLELVHNHFLASLSGTPDTLQGTLKLPHLPPYPLTSQHNHLELSIPPYTATFHPFESHTPTCIQGPQTLLCGKENLYHGTLLLPLDHPLAKLLDIPLKQGTLRFSGTCSPDLSQGSLEIKHACIHTQPFSLKSQCTLTPDLYTFEQMKIWAPNLGVASLEHLTFCPHNAQMQGEHALITPLNHLPPATITNYNIFPTIPQGHATLTFQYPTPFTQNLQLPQELLKHIDPKWLIPTQGQLELSLSPQGITFNHIPYLYSEGKGFKFELDTQPATLSWNGDLNITLKPKNLKAQAKWADFLTLHICGTLDNPHIQIQKRK